MLETIFIGREPPAHPGVCLEDYVRQRCLYRRGLVKELFPCIYCYGDGWNYDPNDPPCVVEGNKGRRRLTCVVCDGSGTGPLSAWKPAYQEAKEKYKRELREWRRMFRIWNRLMKVLTDEDLRALSIFGLQPRVKEKKV